MRIDMKGVFSDRMALVQVKEKVEQEFGMEFPLTDLAICEWYFRAGLTLADEPIASMVTNSSFLQEYFRRYFPFNFSDLDHQLEQLYEDGLLKTDWDRNLRKSERELLQDIRKTTASSFHSMNEDQTFIFTNHKLSRLTYKLFSLELDEQWIPIYPQVVLTNCEITFYVEQETVNISAQPAKWDDSIELNLEVGKANWRELLLPEFGNAFLAQAHCIVHTARELEEPEGFVEQSYKSFLLPTLRKLFATYQTQECIECFQVLSRYLSKALPYSQVRLDLMLEYAELLLACGFNDGASRTLRTASTASEKMPMQSSGTKARIIELRIATLDTDLSCSFNAKLIRDLERIPVHKRMLFRYSMDELDSTLEILNHHEDEPPNWIDNIYETLKKRCRQAAIFKIALDLHEYQQQVYSPGDLPLYRTVHHIHEYLSNLYFIGNAYRDLTDKFEQLEEEHRDMAEKSFQSDFHLDIDNMILLLSDVEKSYIKMFVEGWMFKEAIRLVEEERKQNGPFSIKAARLTALMARQFDTKLWSQESMLVEKYQWLLEKSLGEDDIDQIFMLHQMLEVRKQASGFRYNRRGSLGDRTYNRYPYSSLILKLAELEEKHKEELGKYRNYYRFNNRKDSDLLDAYRFECEKERAHAILVESLEREVYQEENRYSFNQSPLTRLLKFYMEENRWLELHDRLEEVYEYVLRTYGATHKFMLEYWMAVGSFYDSIPSHVWRKGEDKVQNQLINAVISPFIEAFKQTANPDWSLANKICSKLAENKSKEDAERLRDFFLSMRDSILVDLALQEKEHKHHPLFSYFGTMKNLSELLLKHECWDVLADLCVYLLKSQIENYTKNYKDSDANLYLNWVLFCSKHLDAKDSRFKQLQVIAGKWIPVLGPKHPKTRELSQLTKRRG